MTCPHCEELREENRALKRELSYALQQDQVDRLKLRYALQPGEAQVLAALYNAKGRVLSAPHLDEIVPRISAGEDRDLKHVTVRICRLRKRLGNTAISNVWGRGYCLSDLGRVQVEEALEAPSRRSVS